MLKVSRIGLVALVGTVLVLFFHRAIASYFCNIAAPYGAIDRLACPIALGAYGIRFVALGTAAVLSMIVLAAVATRKHA